MIFPEPAESCYIRRHCPVVLELAISAMRLTRLPISWAPRVKVSGRFCHWDQPAMEIRRTRANLATLTAAPRNPGQKTSVKDIYERSIRLIRAKSGEHD